jgi:ferredoxin
MNTRTKCTAKNPCKACKELRESGVILHKAFKHVIGLDAPEAVQHDAHCQTARIVCPVKKIEIQPKFKYGKRVF